MAEGVHPHPRRRHRPPHRRGADADRHRCRPQPLRLLHGQLGAGRDRVRQVAGRAAGPGAGRRRDRRVRGRRGRLRGVNPDRYSGACPSTSRYAP
ncbi:Exonuclease SbcC [Streptomyces misionensis JCM 4497]